MEEEFYDSIEEKEEIDESEPDTCSGCVYAHYITCQCCGNEMIFCNEWNDIVVDEGCDRKLS